MFKFVAFIMLIASMLIAVAAINISDVNAREETKFIQISVLAEDQADYGVDEKPLTIPSISKEIIEDKVHDIKSTSSVPVITYTSLPRKDSEADEQETNGGTQPAGNGDEGNDNHGNNGNNGNGGPNGNQEPGGNHGNGAGNDNSNSSQNNGNGNTNKEKEKESGNQNNSHGNNSGGNAGGNNGGGNDTVNNGGGNEGGNNGGGNDNGNNGGGNSGENNENKPEKDP